MTPDLSQTYTQEELNRIAREVKPRRPLDGEKPWKVEDQHGGLIGEYVCGKEAFAAAQIYLGAFPDASACVVYPDGFRLTERKAAAPVAALLHGRHR